MRGTILHGGTMKAAAQKDSRGCIQQLRCCLLPDRR
jgi:hypothetical protein